MGTSESRAPLRRREGFEMQPVLGELEHRLVERVENPGVDQSCEQWVATLGKIAHILHVRVMRAVTASST
jgi:hypothetical protein